MTYRDEVVTHDPELVARMERLVREMAEHLRPSSSYFEEASEIAKLLPDPDLEAARDIADSVAGDSDPYRSPLVRKLLMESALAGIKHGRGEG